MPQSEIQTADRDILIALNLVPKLGAGLISQLHGYFGSYRRILEADVAALRDSGAVTEARAIAIVEALKTVAWEREIEKAAQYGVELLTLADPSYPELLRQIHAPPPVLYCRGDIAALRKCSVAIIGSRNASVYGMESAKKLSSELAAAGVNIVSGLALGIDTAAHTGALDGGGTTVGVLGGAMDYFYPSQNLALAERIVENGGAIISEFPFGRHPDKGTFPQRNRIVSGLCRCIVVVETGVKGGTMITVERATEQNRTVMAVPGRIDSFRSAGCNLLIRDGAGIVTCSEDIIRELGTFFPSIALRAGIANARTAEGPGFDGLSPDEKTIFKQLDDEAIEPERLIDLTGLDAGRLGAALIGLQMRKLIRALPGGAVQRIV